MADFLSNLVARAMRQGPRLERRRPSLFEPAMGPPHAPSGEGLSLETSEEREAPPPARTRAVRFRRDAGEDAQQEEMQTPRVPPAPRSASAEMEAPPQEAPRPAAALPTPRVVKEVREVTGQRIVPERTLLTEKRETVREIVRTDRETIAVRERVELRPAPMPPPRRSAERLHHDADKPLAPARVVERIVTRENARALPPPIAALPPRRRERPQAQPPMPSAETPAPSVSVSIGRVEIRTAQPSAPPSRASRPSAPKVSLDDYLRGRNGGSL